MRKLTLLLALTLLGCGTSDPCEKDPSFCTGSCAGPCAPDAPNLALFMMYLWSGPAGSTPPPCPEVTPQEITGTLDAPPPDVTCDPPCACGPSASACFLPDDVTAAPSACGAAPSGAPAIPLPDTWDGACTAAAAMPPVGSVTVSPAIMSTDRACAPSTVKATKIAGGTTAALACFTNPLVPGGLCPRSSPICTYPPEDGFSICLFQADGDVACPPGWPQKHLMFLDDLTCECECGAPSGDSCATTVTAYEDGACSKPLGSASVTADEAQCVDVAPGSMVGSVSASPPVYHAGTCTPKLTKSLPSTMCCLP